MVNSPIYDPLIRNKVRQDLESIQDSYLMTTGKTYEVSVLVGDQKITLGVDGRMYVEPPKEGFSPNEIKVVELCES